MDGIQHTAIEFLDLPSEILLSIISFVPCLDDIRSLCRVNKRINGLAEPFLYHEIDVIQGTHAANLSENINTKSARATWIKSLLVSTRFDEDEGLSLLPPKLRLMRNLRHLRLETPDCNAKAPSLRIPWVQLQERYERIFESSSLLLPAADRLLPRLQSCTLHFVDDEKEIYCLSKYATLFLHPTLRSLTISCASTDLPNNLLAPFQSDPLLEKQTALEFLHLEECDIYEPSLAILLSFPKALKAFKLSEGIRYEPNRGYHPRKHGNVDPELFVEALAKNCQNSLEWLSLSLGHIRKQHQSINSAGQYLDLTAFHRIKHLELDARTTFLLVPATNCDHALWKRVPPKLESLKVFDNPLGASPPFEPFGRKYWPFHDCVVKEKARHGLQNLRVLTYSFITHARDTDEAVVDDEGDELEVETNRYQQEKTRLIAAAANSYQMHKKAGVRLKIILVSLPRGYIPPYLNAEDYPVENVIWDRPIETPAPPVSRNGCRPWTL